MNQATWRPTPLGGSQVAPPGASARTGLYFLLAVITSLFLLLCIALLVRAQYSDWESLAEPWQPLARPGWLWFSTALLLLASIAMHWACRAARRQDRAATLNRLLLAGVCSAMFVAGQLWVWQWLYSHGIGVAGNPANSFFYLITGLHGLHIIGGLIAWALVVLNAHKLTMRQLQEKTRLCATYWHYLLGIWLLLFALLTSSTQTFRSIAGFCGF